MEKQKKLVGKGVVIIDNLIHWNVNVMYIIPSRLLHNPIYEPCSRCSEFRLCTLTCTFLRKQIFAANERKHKHVVVGILNYFSCSNLRHCRVKLVHFFPQKFRGGGRPPLCPPLVASNFFSDPLCFSASKCSRGRISYITDSSNARVKLQCIRSKISYE